jgi:FMN phosphatase YigB (HAD superfamily)
VTESAGGGWPHEVDAVLLDAGGVLLDLDYRYLRRLISTRLDPLDGLRITDHLLAAHEALARQEIHRQVLEGGRTSAAWRDYFHSILGRAGVREEHREGLIDALWEAHQRVGLWTVAVERGPRTVRELKRRGYRLAVVSNAEGNVARDLDAAGYRGAFGAVVDSHVVGVEKPDPAIFALALERIGAAAERSIFVGDVPSVDVAGARAAGIAPVLLDRHGTFPDVDAPRIAALEELLVHLPGSGEVPGEDAETEPAQNM